jgi:hypothetical protein
MPYGQPAQLANLKPPWKSGDSVGRRSRDVDRALRLARQHSPEAIVYCAKVLNDASVDERGR